MRDISKGKVFTDAEIESAKKSMEESLINACRPGTRPYIKNILLSIDGVTDVDMYMERPGHEILQVTINAYVKIEFIKEALESVKYHEMPLGIYYEFEIIREREV